ncbi:chymotrypsin family serine protease [Thermincola ferriacetica]
MEKIKATIQKYQNSLFSRANVCGVGMGKKMVRSISSADAPMSIVVLVKKKLPESELRVHDIVPKEINGIPTDVIEVGDIKLQASRTIKYKKVQPGVSIGHYKITAGTLGAVVKDKKTGQLLILSNNHVLANGSNGNDGRAKIGDPILQPGPHDGGTRKDEIGTLYKFVPVHRETVQPACAKAAAAEFWANVLVKMVAPKYVVKVLRKTQTANIVDAALAKPNDPNRLDPTILDIGPVKGVAEAEVGMNIKKSGRTTGVTKGQVKAVNATVQVDMGDGTEAVFADQIIASGMSQGGDSGSLVLDEQNRAVGLLFAGSDKVTILNRIQNVMDKLSIAF